MPEADSKSAVIVQYGRRGRKEITPLASSRKKMNVEAVVIPTAAIADFALFTCGAVMSTSGSPMVAPQVECMRYRPSGRSGTTARSSEDCPIGHLAHRNLTCRPTIPRSMLTA